VTRREEGRKSERSFILLLHRRSDFLSCFLHLPIPRRDTADYFPANRRRSTLVPPVSTPFALLSVVFSPLSLALMAALLPQEVATDDLSVASVVVEGHGRERYGIASCRERQSCFDGWERKARKTNVDSMKRRGSDICRWEFRQRRAVSVGLSSLTGVEANMVTRKEDEERKATRESDAVSTSKRFELRPNSASTTRTVGGPRRQLSSGSSAHRGKEGTTPSLPSAA
jgi:hypothetical protein